MAHTTTALSNAASSGRFPGTFRALTLLALAGWGAVPFAQAQTVGAPAQALRDVVISGTRSEQDPDELPMSIDVIRASDIEYGQVRDMRDAVSNLPNVVVPRAPARFTIGSQTGRDQNSGFNIRGLEGNRVLMLIDGVRQPRSYVFPSESAVGRDYIDMSLVKRIEVLRGATPALYGSDGVGGLVNFITKDPADYLSVGKSLGGTASVGYSGDSKGWNTGVTVAGRASESLDWLLSANTSRSDALKNMGTNGSANVTRTTPNPETDRQSSVLGKLVFSPGGGQKHVFTFEHVDKEAAYNLLSNVSVPPLVAASVLASSGDTTMKRDRLTWDGRWQLNAAVVDELRAIVSFQDARSNEYFFQDRNTLADRSRNTNYRERSLQANLQASKLLRAGDTAHKFAYGLDYTSTKVRNVQTGMTPAAGETYPLKRFPDTTESSTALYAQDEFIAGAWSITPGVRMDHFSIDASQAGYTPVAKSMSGSAVSPKLGAIYRFTPQWSAYGNFAAGFKAPTAGQVNGFFSNPLANYQSIANPNLKAEKSRSVEIGVRGRTDGVSLDVAAFTGRYKDFIEEFQQVGGAFTPTNPAIYQAINLNNVTISGFEIKGRVNWGKAGGGTLSSPFAYGQTRGRNTDNNRPLNSVAPQRLSTGLQYEAPTWSLGFNVNHYAAKKLSDVDTTATPNPFLSKAETLIDVSGQWRVQKDLRITAGIYNLTDRKYWRWSDVVGQSATSTTIDAYTQPGRYARVSLVKDF